MRAVAIVVSLTFTAIAVPLVVKAVRDMTAVIRTGGPAIGRTDNKRARWVNMFKETVGHTRMLQWTWIGVMHWFVFAGFIYLASAVLTAYFQIFDAHFALPIIGRFFVFEWITEVLSWLTVIGIVVLIIVRQRNHPRGLGRKSRFFGSSFWQAYFVEAIILGEGVAGLLIRGAEYKIADENANALHFPLTGFIGNLYGDISDGTAENIIYALAMAKILMATIWLIVIARNITMGVAWHRFSVWFNIWFKRNSDGSTALGGLQPIYVKGRPLDLENMDDLEEEDFAQLGVGQVQDFSWKGILDFTTCTECGRCQSQCPAWATDKPLSPKLLVLGLRDHAYAKAPLLALSEDEQGKLSDEEKAELERPLVGDESVYGVIDPDVLWSCTNCGACVQQCPVDIEHVDHIENMRRFQVLVESNFPAELNNIFKGLERKGNPWGMDPRSRMDWAKGLDFEVKQVGVDVEDLDEVDWLFWVGCAGAYEDRAKKTTQAVAELLDMAGVSFAVLGDGETCTGDPARRAGNEIVFQQLAMQNAEVFKETKVKKVVSTCAHCFNALKNEYAEFGVELEVVHHTQLLNRLVREGRLVPVAPEDASAEKKKITYHDPCFLGRHNKVYEPPRELLNVIPGAEFTEMPRNSEKSFCCGAGGARMWMEESLGSRINVNRTEEAIATGADQIAVGCPFCRVMLSDGLTLKQSEGAAREEVQVLDVAQMLLAGVRRGPSAGAAESDVVAEAETATAEASSGGGITDADKAVAAAHNIAIDDKGSATGNPDSDDKAGSEETAEAVPEPKEVELPESTADDTADADPAEESEPGAADKADPDSISRTEDVGPLAEATTSEPDPQLEPGDTTDPEAESVPEKSDDDEPAPVKESELGEESPAEEITHVPDETEPVEQDARKEEAEATEPTARADTHAGTPDDAAEDVPADEKEASAWANVGPVNAPAEPHPEPEPAEESPAEEITHVPDETEPVEQDARDEEAEATGPTAKPDTPEGIVAVEDAPSTADPVSDDAAPLSDANPKGADLSTTATQLGSHSDSDADADADDEDETKA